MIGFALLFFFLIPVGLYTLDIYIGFSRQLTTLDFPLGLILIMVGAVIALSCVLPFIFIGKGTPVPFAAPKQFLVTGLYQYTRNPMMWGFWMVMIGQSFLYRSWSLIVFTVVILIPLSIFMVIYIEEPDLEKRFGEQYRDFKQKIPRWKWKL